MAGGFDGFGRFREGSARLRFRTVVRDGLHFIGVAEEFREADGDSRLAMNKETECRSQAAMRFDNPACAFEQKRLRSVKRRKIGLAAGNLRQAKFGVLGGVIPMTPRGRQEPFGL